MIKRANPECVLALIPNWLGDVAMCTPALRALKRRYPAARLVVAGRRSACDLLQGVPWIDGFVFLPTKGKLRGFLRSVFRLRDENPDLAIVFPHSFRAALLARCSGAAHRLGYDRDNRRALLTDVLVPHLEDGEITPIYMAQEYLELVAALGAFDSGKGLELSADDRAVAEVKEHLVGDGPFVGFAPGAAFGPSKRWPAERYAAVADVLREQVGAKCVLLTGPGEEETRAAVQSAARYRLIECDEGRPTIASLKASISQMDLLICNDSGPRHVAVAFHVPTICIMGSTKPAYSCGPHECGQVLRVDVDCGPCQKPVCATDHRCMTGISPEEVVEAAMAYLPNAKVEDQ